MPGLDTQEASKKRVLHVTGPNLVYNHLYVTGHYDFFPIDCIGGPRRSADSPTIQIYLDGLGRTVKTDIGRDARTNKPRGFLRGRTWLREFYQHHRVKPGALLSLEGLSERTYRLAMQSPDQVVGLECAEFFAGIGSGQLLC
jgi:hypothetical protein